MHNIVLVIKHEIKVTLAKRSFWLLTFLFPVVITGFALLPQIIARDALAEGQATLAAATGMAAGAPRPAIGYVDQGDLIAGLPPDVSADALRAYGDEAAAQAALEAGEISLYYLLPADFVDSGVLVMVEDEFTPLAGELQSGLLQYVINYNLVGDAVMARLLIDPAREVREEALAPLRADGRDMSDPLAFGVPLAVMFVLFFSITMSSGYMLQSVAHEKENRTAEVLLVSLRPLELMQGKVLGLGAVAIFQMAVWAAAGTLLVGGGPSPFAYELPAGFVAWTLLFFVLGYLVYSSALGALGALAPNIREGSQFTFVMILPLLIPLWLNSVFLRSPNGLLATALSLFPLTAPTAMVTRLAAVPVPLWQPIVAVVLLAVTSYLFVRLAARFFRADTLLSDRSLTWRRLVAELKRG